MLRATSPVPPLCALLLVVAFAATNAAGIPHVSECNFCFECEVAAAPTRSAASSKDGRNSNGVPLAVVGGGEDSSSGDARKLLAKAFSFKDIFSRNRSFSAAKEWEELGRESAAVYDKSAVQSGIPGAIADAGKVFSEMIGPADHEKKMTKPNCTKCYGCTARLSDITAAPVRVEELDGMQFKHGRGGTNAWLFFAEVPGAKRRYIVKVFCMPYSKAHGRPQECNGRVYSERIRLIMGQVKLADECGAIGITPRAWVAPLEAVVPNGPFAGYHIRWWALWMEEAQGITLHALDKRRNTTYSLLGERLKGEQVVQQSVMDLLTAQCDRHAENIFIAADGSLSFIDNDRALGVVTHCGSNSMLLPGNAYHTALHLSFWAPSFITYYKTPGKKKDFCIGPVDPRVVLDYRCYVPNGRIGTDYAPPMRTCLEGLAASSAEDVAARYGFATTKPAEILRQRAADMLRMGFERALLRSAPHSSDVFIYQRQPKCCRLKWLPEQQRHTCAKCWKPILEDRKGGEGLAMYG